MVVSSRESRYCDAELASLPRISEGCWQRAERWDVAFSMSMMAAWEEQDLKEEAACLLTLPALDKQSALLSMSLRV